MAQEYEAEGVRVVVDLRYAQIRQAAKQFDVLPAEGVLEINNAE